MHSARPYAAIFITTLLFTCASSHLDAAMLGSCEPQRTFYVVGHDWHSGVVINGLDLAARIPELSATVDGAGLVELGWGDAAFYRAPQEAILLALRAVLLPTDAVLHVVRVPGSDPRAYFPASTVFTLTVTVSGYERLLDYLVQTFARTQDRALIPLGPGLYGQSRFYAATGSFHAFNTCNTWVARAVKAAGYPLQSTTVVTVDGLLSELNRVIDTPCGIAVKSGATP